MIKVCGHQPVFLPWIGYWHKMLSCDQMIVPCAVQFDQRSVQHRVTVNGHWMTIPVRAGSDRKAIMDVQVIDPRHVRNIGRDLLMRMQERRLVHKDRLGPLISYLQNCQDQFLMDICLTSIQHLQDALGIKRQLIVDKVIRPMGKGDGVDARIKAHVSETMPCVYLLGSGSLSYLGYDTLKVPKAVWFQQLRSGLDSNSIVKMIATEDDPLEAIKDCACWIDKEGNCYGWNGAPYPRISPAP